jgi:hypothetical protein
MTLSDADVRRAEKRMQAQLHAQPHATAARYDRRDAKVVVSLSNGLELGVPVRLAQGLSGASTSELADIEISPTGLGLHWPRLDADLYLPALIEGIFGTHRWMARLLGKRGGEVTSAAKKAAARANGRKGGRPRKEAHA